MHPRLRFFTTFWLPPAGWAAAIFISSCIPVPPGQLPSFPLQDKLVHILLYFVLAALIYRAGHGGQHWPWRRALITALAASMLFGLLDEIHQAFVPTRHCDGGDWIADALGAALVLILAGRHPWGTNGSGTSGSR